MDAAIFISSNEPERLIALPIGGWGSFHYHPFSVVSFAPV